MVAEARARLSVMAARVHALLSFCLCQRMPNVYMTV